MTPSADAEPISELPDAGVKAEDVRAALVGAPVFVALDDDPTGTQTVSDVPVLTRWRLADVRWALAQGAAGFYVLTNTRSQSPADAAQRVREVVDSCLAAADSMGTSLVFASRSDSTLRGHFPVEVNAIRSELVRHDQALDGIILAPAYVDAGRVTVHGVHLLRDGTRFTPVAESEFAADATFGYRSSRLADWVAEKSERTIPAEAVTSIDLRDLRGDHGRCAALKLAGLRDGEVAVLDALDDADLRRAAVEIAKLEKDDRRFIFQVGPSFVRARLGQEANPPVADGRLAELLAGPEAHGLVVVGSHVGVTTRQLAALRADRPVADVEIDVAALLDSADQPTSVSDLADTVAERLRDSLVVVSTSRRLVRGTDENDSLAIARRVSDALTTVVRLAVQRVRPAYVVAKGGITSSDIATEALGIERAWARGSLLPGIVSLWQAEGGPSAGLPYVVFAGNVGDDSALAHVVGRLERARIARPTEREST